MGKRQAAILKQAEEVREGVEHLIEMLKRSGESDMVPDVPQVETRGDTKDPPPGGPPNHP